MHGTHGAGERPRTRADPGPGRSAALAGAGSATTAARTGRRELAWKESEFTPWLNTSIRSRKPSRETSRPTTPRRLGTDSCLLM
ncbi:hypothetical protein STRIP9103_00454 [Streptomyces ipomoeae 91-03]|uniref:Uncharacterized protein n=1 Tax=Streptomyces ipomoeae 91-03 TaxID=698759 RepID=L1KQA7_9ACTN|nr:hypothetical protein STRIP9103_00454 [Streptomyces ipomoeae 91-03]